MTTIITADQDAIVSEIDIAAPPERVFQALSTADQLKRWWTSPECPLDYWEMDARPKGRWQFDTKPGSLSVNGVNEFHCHGEIVDYDPPRLLAYTWIANWHDDRSRRTVVRYDLTAEEGGTNIKVTHSGLAQETASRKGYAEGWPEVLEKLKQYVEH